jgi:hypothetical protein
MNFLFPVGWVVESLLYVQVFDCVNIGEGKAMKRLSYLTMIFLPASFVAVRVLLHLSMSRLAYRSLSSLGGHTPGGVQYANPRTETAHQWLDSALRSDGFAVDGADDMDHHGDRMER